MSDSSEQHDDILRNIGFYKVPSVGPGETYIETLVRYEGAMCATAHKHVQWRGPFKRGDSVMVSGAGNDAANCEAPFVVYESAGYGFYSVVEEKGVVVKSIKCMRLRRPWATELASHRQAFVAAAAFVAQISAKAEQEAIAQKKNYEDAKEEARYAAMSQADLLRILTRVTKCLEALASEK